MTDAPADILPLAADFPPATREQWLELVARLLNGAPFDRKLVAKTYDGLTIQPLYAGTAQGQAPAGRILSSKVQAFDPGNASPRRGSWKMLRWQPWRN